MRRISSQFLGLFILAAGVSRAGEDSPAKALDHSDLSSSALEAVAPRSASGAGSRPTYGGSFQGSKRIIDWVFTPEELSKLSEEQQLKLEERLVKARRSINRQLLLRGRLSGRAADGCRVEIEHQGGALDEIREDVYLAVRDAFPQSPDSLQERLARKLDPKLAFFGRCTTTIQIREIPGISAGDRYLRVTVKHTGDLAGRSYSVQMSAEEFEREFGLAPPCD